MSSEKKETPQDRWHKAYTKSVNIRFMTKTEQDILDRLNAQPSKAGYIKRLIREDMERAGR